MARSVAGTSSKCYDIDCKRHAAGAHLDISVPKLVCVYTPLVESDEMKELFD